jgi:hypothetical protein
MSVKTIYAGPFVHSESSTKLDICLTGAIGVDETGKISFVKRDVKDAKDVAKQELGWEDAKIVQIGKLEFFFPGFIGKCGRCWAGKMHMTTNEIRYSHSCVSVPKCRYLWQIYTFGLAQQIYVPARSILPGP